MMFRKILIANRGEIACRVIATARRMGIATVAVYSDADIGARHVEMADEAMGIGPAPVAESYLRTGAILAAAQATGAEAIHPGYGFLSENAGFVEAVNAAGLTFIGPPAEAIRAMGLKDAAKRRMEAAGVPVVPGFHGETRDAELLAAEAAQIGYPVLIKARAGGGGKGMRMVDAAQDFAHALAAAEREAEASFGDPHCLVEKYVATPRHVEIQVFADAHGNVVHLFERDCSLQRRHQKVIEEAPAPGMPTDVRDAMGRAAVEAARAIGYVGAGTVEFIADGSDGLRTDGFWFMEMNTRLQVEHPVTEAITGLDLVELQIRVAAGAPLPFAQEDLHITGHAIEARIYAEDPEREFLPSIGRLDHLAFPDASAFTRGRCRVDSGVRAGDEISPHYDPMIAKLIVHGADRATALTRLGQALEATEIVGLTTNTRFLSALARTDGFATGAVDTGLIGRHPELCAPSALPPLVRDAALLLALGLADAPGAAGPWDQLRGWRAWGSAQQTARVVHRGAPLSATVAFHPGTSVDGVPVALSHQADGALAITRAGARVVVRHVATAEGFALIHRGQVFSFTRPDLVLVSGAAAASDDHVLSPMPGKVTDVHVAVGDAVGAGAPLMILEAMKMEHVLTAPRAGVIARLAASAGDQVSDGTVLVALEPEDG